MRVGVGLPNVHPGTSRETILEWARRAEAGPFESVGVLHRTSWDVHDPLETLAAAAGATSHVRLVTMVAVAPIYETDRLAKEASSIQEVSGGRLVLGVSVGARHADYEAAGVDPRRRGQRLDEQLASLPELWGEAQTRPSVLVGGSADIAFARMARWSDGYVHGGGPPRGFGGAALKARAAWADYERPGSPQLWGQSYFVLGDEETVAEARSYLRDYYEFTGPFVERIVEDLLETPQQIAARVRGYADEGCDELILLPATTVPEQIDRLAEVLAG